MRIKNHVGAGLKPRRKLLGRMGSEMLANLCYAAILTSISVLVHMLGLIRITNAMNGLFARYRIRSNRYGRGMAMVIVVLSLFFLHLTEVFVWATGFLLTHTFSNFDDSVYVSMVTFSTLGYGDLALHPTRRLLVSIEGIIGFLLIGWTTAYLISASTRYGPFKSGTHF